LLIHKYKFSSGIWDRFSCYIKPIIPNDFNETHQLYLVDFHKTRATASFWRRVIKPLLIFRRLKREKAALLGLPFLMNEHIENVRNVKLQHASSLPYPTKHFYEIRTNKRNWNPTPFRPNSSYGEKRQNRNREKNRIFLIEICHFIHIAFFFFAKVKTSCKFAPNLHLFRFFFNNWCYALVRYILTLWRFASKSSYEGTFMGRA
jgi:hypothetical protein